MIKKLSKQSIAVAAAVMFSVFALASVSAQSPNDWDWDGNFQRLARINPGTFITVRTTQAIQSDRTDGRVFGGVVADDVWDDYGRLSVPAIPRGSRVGMIVRTARDGDLVLDLDSIDAHGQRYSVTAAPERIESGNRRNDNNTAAYAGGGAVLGTIIGAIAGGGKGAAIGAAAGGGAGTAVVLNTRGEEVRIGRGQTVLVRLTQPIRVRVRG